MVFQKGHNLWPKGSRHTEETKKKISISKSGKNHPMYGKHLPEKTRRKIGLANKGNRHTEETKRKIGLASKGRKTMLGKKHSKEAKRKMSETRKRLFREEKLKPIMLGKQHSEETKRKISLANTGKRRTEEVKRKLRLVHGGKNHHFYGKKFTEEHKKNISLSLKKSYKEGKFVPWSKTGHYTKETRMKMRLAKRGKYLGNNNPNWRGGKSFEPYGLEFNNDLKLIIRFRDSFTCQECRMIEIFNGRYLNSHHIDYDKTNNNLWNLISLCDACHIATNFKRHFWTDHFQKLMVKS